MSNPAVEAARRADEANDGWPWDTTRVAMVEAAREALKPIRALHKPEWSNCINACCSGEDCRNRSRLCKHCWVDWPCDTAKLVYSTEELER